MSGRHDTERRRRRDSFFDPSLQRRPSTRAKSTARPPRQPLFDDPGYLATVGLTFQLEKVVGSLEDVHAVATGSTAVGLIVRHVFGGDGIGAGGTPLFRYREIKSVVLDLELSARQEEDVKRKIGIAQTNLRGLFKGHTEARCALLPSSKTVSSGERLIEAVMGVRQESEGEGLATQVPVILAVGLKDNDLADLLTRRKDALNPHYRWSVDCCTNTGSEIGASVPVYSGAPLFLILVRNAIDYEDNHSTLSFSHARLNEIFLLLWVRWKAPSAIPYFRDAEIQHLLSLCREDLLLDAQMWARQVVELATRNNPRIGHDYLKWWQREFEQGLEGHEYEYGLELVTWAVKEMARLLHLDRPPPPPPTHPTSTPYPDAICDSEPEEPNPFNLPHPVSQERPSRPPHHAYPPSSYRPPISSHNRRRPRSHSQSRPISYAHVEVDPALPSVDDLRARFGGMQVQEGLTDEEDREEEERRQRLKERMKPIHQRASSRMR